MTSPDQSFKKKIAVIGSVGIPAQYGGFEMFVEYLTKYCGEEYDFTVFCSSKSYPKKLESYNNAKLKYIPLSANGIQSIPYDVISMIRSLFWADVMIILGIGGCFFLPFIRIFTPKTKLFVNIDGLEWKRDKWSRLARWYFKLAEAFAVRFATHVVSDNQGIVDYVNETYQKASLLIEYGADHQQPVPFSPKDIKQYPFLNKQYAFTVCRIEPENRIHEILEVFSQTDMQMAIVGNWQHSVYGQGLFNQYQKCRNIFLIDPIYDITKLNLLRSNCALYVHGHYCGGTNPSLVEAMYLGLAIIASDVTFNRYTTENQALYFSSKEMLLDTINKLNDEELKEIAKNMKEIAFKRYTWANVLSKYKNVL